MVYLWIGVALEVLADFAFKWAADGKTIVFAAGWALYIGAALLWGLALKTVPLAVGNTTFLTANIILVAIGGVVIFEEALTPLQWVGVGLALASILCLR